MIICECEKVEAGNQQRRLHNMEKRQIKVRTDKANYYLNIAEEVSKRGTCIRNNYGSVIVNNDEVISTGYTGAPRGRVNCSDLGECRRRKNNTPSGAGYEKCRSVHSEQNAIISASRREMIGATLYLVGINARNGEYKENAEPCTLCKRMIINAGIETVIIRVSKTEYNVIKVSSWIDENDDTLKD